MALKLIETFVDKAEDPSAIASAYVPAMMDPILGDYARAVPDARWVNRARWAWHVGLGLQVHGADGAFGRRAYGHGAWCASCVNEQGMTEGMLQPAVPAREHPS